MKLKITPLEKKKDIHKTTNFGVPAVHFAGGVKLTINHFAESLGSWPQKGYLEVQDT